MTLKRHALMYAAALALLLPLQALPARNPGGACASGKQKAAGIKAVAKLRCYAAAAARGGNVNPVCLAKAERKFAATWAKLEARGGCATTRDVSRIEAQVDAFVSTVASLLPATTTIEPSPTCENGLIAAGMPCGNCAGFGQCFVQCVPSAHVCVDTATHGASPCISNGECPPATPICASKFGTCGGANSFCYAKCSE